MNQDSAGVSFFHPSTKLYRFTILIFVASLSFGSYFAYDIVGAIAPTLVEELGEARGILGTLYSMYHLAAILLVLVGGLLIDKLGTRRSSLIFSTLVLIGSILVWRAHSVPVYFIGRFIFGAGSEPLIVAQSAIIARWFKNKEIALAFGITLTVSRLGTLFAFNTGELITDVFGSFRYALLVAVIACLVSVVGNLFYILMDRRAEKVGDQEDDVSSEKIVFSDIKQLKPSFWYVTLLCTTFYSAIFPFTALSTDFFVEKWGIAEHAVTGGAFLSQVFENFLHMFNTAGGITSIVIFASMIFAPFAGQLVDKIGKRASLMILGSLIMIPCHALMGLTHINPIIPMIFLGAAFVLVPAAMWPCIPLIVHKDRVGTGYGLMTAVQNVGLALFPFLNGKLRDITRSYTSSMLMFAFLGVAGLVFALLLKKDDQRSGHVLEKP